MPAARLLPWLAIPLAVLATLLAAMAAERSAPVPSVPEAAAGFTARSALGPALARCQALGEAGARDADCLAAWAANRRHFLGLGPALSKE